MKAPDQKSPIKDAIPSRLCLNDITKTCRGKRHISRLLNGVDRIIIHRIGGTLGETGQEISDWFTTHEEGQTGLKTPYHFIIRKDGTIDQLLALTKLAPHARRYNRTSVAIACIGDFRRHVPTPEQIVSLERLCAIMSRFLRGAQISGHTELPQASLDPKKVCPGKKLDLRQLRFAVAERLAKFTPRLEDVGIVV